MASRKPLIKKRAIKLRHQGHSYNEISSLLNISKSTCSKWLLGIKLNKQAIKRLIEKRERGRINSALTLRQYAKERDQYIQNKVARELSEFQLTNITGKLLCASLYWAEGGKNASGLYFANSDPAMIKVFVNLLRTYFEIKEDKLKALLHLHEYHEINKQKNYWSRITKIPVNRISIYKKPNSGHNIREGYPGCISIRYYDINLAKEIYFLYNALSKLNGGVG